MLESFQNVPRIILWFKIEGEKQPGVARGDGRLGWVTKVGKDRKYMNEGN